MTCRMKRKKISKATLTIIYLATSIFLFACTRQYKYPVALERINYIAEENPHKAITELAKLAPQIADAPKREQMRYELLKVKANDKAFITHTDDSIMLQVLAYFERHGTDNERMEANYYMGSVYRDMHESPKTIVYYSKAIEAAQKTDENIDHLTLSSIYAQLANLYYDRGIYNKAINFTKQEVWLAKKYGFLDLGHILDLARCYRMAGYIDSAKSIFIAVQDSLPAMRKRKDYSSIAEIGSFFLNNDMEFAKKCTQEIEEIAIDSLSYTAHSFLAEYYKRQGRIPEEKKELLLALKSSTTHYQERAIIRSLLTLYQEYGDLSSALQQAERYIALTDSIQIMEKLRETVQADNEFRYNQRAEKDRENRERASRNERYMWIAISLLLFAMVLGTWTYILMSGRLRERTRENAELRRRSEETERLLLEEIKKNNGQQLALKELVNHLRDAANHGGRIQEERIWQQLYGAVEQENPGFNERITARIIPLSDEAKKLCHLFRAGLSQAEAARIMDFSSMTASRKRRRIVSLLGCDIEKA